MRWRRCSVALIPVAAGLVVASLFAQVSALPNPIIYVHVDVGNAALLAGLALSILAAAGLVSWEWKRWRCSQHIASVRAHFVLSFSLVVSSSSSVTSSNSGSIFGRSSSLSSSFASRPS